MPICPKCQIEYKEGLKFCGECGATLVSKEEFTLAPEKKEVETSRKPLFCPNCHLAYEFGEICVQCGSPLGSKSKESLASPQSIEDFKELFPSSNGFSEETPEKPKRLICPNCKLIYERSTFCIRCGSSLIEELSPQEKKPGETQPQDEIEQEKTETISLETKKDKIQRMERKESPAIDPKKKFPSIQKPVEKEEETPSFYDEEGLSWIETSEKIPKKKTMTQILKELRFPKKGIKKIRGVSFQMVSILILIVAVGYLLWSIYSLISPKQPKSDLPASKEYFSIIPPKDPALKPSVPPPSPSSPTSYSSIGEIEDIKNLLETIRRANLQKDIDLFMSCYSSNFKDRESKKKSTLQNWKSFNYLDLSYDLKKYSLSEDKVSIRVEWTIRFSSRLDGQLQETKTILDAILIKEESGWKIKEILPIS